MKTTTPKALPLRPPLSDPFDVGQRSLARSRGPNLRCLASGGEDHLVTAGGPRTGEARCLALFGEEPGSDWGLSELMVREAGLIRVGGLDM